LLATWLGPNFAVYGPLMSLLTIHLSVNLAVLPIFPIQTATKRVRLPGIVTLLLGCVNLALAFLLAGPIGWGLYGVAAAGAIVLTAKNLLFTPIYGAIILGRKPWTLLHETLPVSFAAFATFIACKALCAAYDLSGWKNLIVSGSTISIIYAILVYSCALSSIEREMIWGMIRTPKLRSN
jgi:hypothetical protein